MIEIIVQAGFGNQLFQYALGYSLSKKLNRDLILNVSSFDYMKKKINGDSLRINNLDKLNIPSPNFLNEPDGFKKYLLGAKIKSFTSLPLIRFKNKVLWENVKNCRDYQSHLIEKIAKYSKVTLYGFWQHPSYFNDYIQELKFQFVPNYNLSEDVKKYKFQIEGSKNSVGIHIRRGDFVRLGWAEDISYYNKGIAKIKDILGDCNFFVFTDDKEWGRLHFAHKNNCTIIDINSETKDIDEFFLLSLCEHHIISESTYGWWAAFLNTNSDKLIIIPSYAKGELFPKEWIRI